MKSMVVRAAAAAVLMFFAGRDGRAMENAEVVAPADTLVTNAVRLRLGPNDVCSGTLVDPIWVLTADHCLKFVDASFGTNGSKAYSAPHAGEGAITDVMAVDGPGARRWITVGWKAQDPDAESIWRAPLVMALQGDGSLDPSFDGDGIATLEPTAELEADLASAAQYVAVVRRSAIDTRPIAIGTLTANGDPSMLVIRYRNDGGLDTTPWNRPDQMTQGFTPIPGTAKTAVIVDNGLIVAGNTTDGKWAAARYLLDGPHSEEPDPSFAPIGSWFDGTLADLIVAGDRLVWLGTQRLFPTSAPQPILVTTDGLGHIIHTKPLPADLNPVRLVADPSTASVFVIGEQAGARVRVLRRSVIGLDPGPSWNPAGVTSAPIEDRLGDAGLPRGVAIRDAVRAADGKLVVLAEFDSSLAGKPNGLVRFNVDGTNDLTFRQSGTSFISYDEVTKLEAIAMDASHRILVAGRKRFEPTTADPVAHKYSWISVLTDTTATTPLKVIDGTGASRDVAAAYAHPIPGVDAALLKLATPAAMPPAATATFQGRALAGAPADGALATITCYGSGHAVANADPNARPLRRGRFRYDALRHGEIDLESDPAAFNKGDSGGGCFTVDDGVSKLVGVTSAFAEHPDNVSAIVPRDNRVVDPSRFAVWYMATTHLTLPLD